MCQKQKSTTPHLSRAPTSISRLEKRAARRHDPVLRCNKIQGRCLRPSGMVGKQFKDARKG